MELKGSRTERNLREAFAGETQARSKYDYFASVAKKEGYEQIAAIFQATANNEKEHAKMWFKALGGSGTTGAKLASAAGSLKRARRPCGSAATAAIWSSGRRPRRSVPCAPILRAILRCGKRTIDPAGPVWMRRAGGRSPCPPAGIERSDAYV